MSNEKADAPTEHDSIIATAKKRFALAEEAENTIRQLALDDWKFRAGEQWPEAVKREREIEGRPVIVINRILQSIRQVTNEQRQNRPAIKAHPVDDNADIETAKIYQGMIRHIEQDSGADVAYDTAFEGAATGGFGFWRVLTEYVDPTSFEQEIKIEQIEDPFSVFIDPSSKKPDGSDANWGFIVSTVPKEDFIAEYGESKLSAANEWDTFCSSTPEWVKAESVRIAEYFYKEFKTVKVIQLSDGSTIEANELAELFPEGLPPEITAVAEKSAKVPVIKWCKLNGVEVLEETVWPGRWIPIVPVYGDKFIIEGKRVLEGIVRHAKDPQRMLNYWKATETETITLAPKAPFIVAEGQIPKAYEGQWKLANRKSYAFLTYKPTTHEGQLVPAPQRNFGEPPVQSITQASMFASDDIKATTGIYDAAMGNRSNETSGVAIQRRTMQAQTSNFHLVDNLTRSIRHTGRILIDLIPKIYDTARAARIIGEEGEEEVVRLNQEFERRGERVHYKMGVGKYDVSVDTGPSFATKRQEAAQSMLDLAKAAPNIMQVAPDLIAKNLDLPGGQELAERLKKTLPPGLAEDKDQKPIPPEVQAQLAQLQQMAEQLTNELNASNEIINQKRMELESKERIEFKKLEVQLELKRAELDAQDSRIVLENEIAQITQRLNLLHVNQPIENEFNQAGPDQLMPADQPLTGELPPGLPME